MSINDKITDPEKPFFILITQDNNDGSIDESCDMTIHISLENALAAGQSEFDAHGSQSFIYECHAVAKILRKADIVTIKPNKTLDDPNEVI